MNKTITENTMHGIFILGLFAYGLFLINIMGKQTHQTLEILNGAPMADMPPIIELRKENQNFVTYK
jgi:ABC-type Mn2+/Zn2+ transport system permease subunit